MRRNYLIYVLALFVMAACSMAPVLGNNLGSLSLVDGTYEGKYYNFPNSAKVEITVRDGRIADVLITRWVASWYGSQAKEQVVEQIIEQQSTDVDVVTGATNSSRVLMNAVHRAVEKATSGEGVRSSRGSPPQDGVSSI